MKRLQVQLPGDYYDYKYPESGYTPLPRLTVYPLQKTNTAILPIVPQLKEYYFCFVQRRCFCLNQYKNCQIQSPRKSSLKEIQKYILLQFKPKGQLLYTFPFFTYCNFGCGKNLKLKKKIYNIIFKFFCILYI